jgi:hypothetical protein
MVLISHLKQDVSGGMLFVSPHSDPGALKACDQAAGVAKALGETGLGLPGASFRFSICGCGIVIRPWQVLSD